MCVECVCVCHCASVCVCVECVGDVSASITEGGVEEGSSVTFDPRPTPSITPGRLLLAITLNMEILCLSVRPSVHPSVRPSVTLSFCVSD